MRGALVAIVMLAPVPALAGLAKEVVVTCPVCGNGFHADQCCGANGLRGQDRDFLDHEAGGPEPLLIGCWTCPRCCYTGFRRDFDPKTAPRELAARLKKENPLRPAEPIDPGLDHSGKIAAWVRYGLLIQVLKLRPGTTAEQLANACLEAAQTQRLGFDAIEQSDFGKRFFAHMHKVYPPRRGGVPYRIDLEIARAFESQAGDRASSIDAAERLDLRVGAALLYKIRGEDADTLRVLASLDREELPADLRAVVAEIRVRTERERKYQLLAIPYLEKHLAEGGPDRVEHCNWACRGPAPGAIGSRYLLGLLYLRTGEPKRARAALEPLLELEGIPEPFQPTSTNSYRDWIEDEIAKAKG